MTHTCPCVVGTGSYFNPHEREARDAWIIYDVLTDAEILIHTSVKLVTEQTAAVFEWQEILIHTSVKLVTGLCQVMPLHLEILIHTSVKLVTR